MPEPLHPQIPTAPHGGHAGLDSSGPDRSGLDFSVNSNPYGPNPVLVTAASTADLASYPDAQHRPTRRRLADWHGLDAEQISLGVGASELLYRLALAYLRPGAAVLSLGPAFGEFGRACRLAGAELIEAELNGRASELEALRPTLVYLCRPHNPLGVSLPLEEVQALAERCQASDALLILDEAYLPLSPEVGTVDHPAVVRLRSPGKAHGVVGLRLAYALSSAQVGAQLRNLAPAWALPSPTLAALEALPDGQRWLDGTLPPWRAGAAVLAKQLGRLTEVSYAGLPFFLAHLGPDVLEALSARDIYLRDCSSYGLSGWARLSARRAEENSVLFTALGELL
jgi:histidinol-phosphate aminotransferase